MIAVLLLYLMFQLLLHDRPEDDSSTAEAAPRAAKADQWEILPGRKVS